MASKKPKAIGEPRQKTLLYKRGAFTIEPCARTLEQLLNQAWEQTRTIGERSQPMADEGAKLITSFRTQVHEMTFFEILSYVPGMKALGAALDFNKETIDPQQVELKDEKGKKLELIENILYLGVKNNHAVILQAAAISSPLLETHINWLLSTAGIELVAGQRVMLANRTPPGEDETIRKAKSIEFGAQLGMAPLNPGGEQRGTTTLHPVGRAWLGVKNLLAELGGGMADVAHELEVDGLTEATPIDVTIKLAWKKKKKDSAHAMLDRIATGLRHVDSEADYTIEGPHGRLTKDKFIVRSKKSVRCLGERPIRHILHKSMADWLSDLLLNKTVE